VECNDTLDMFEVHYRDWISIICNYFAYICFGNIYLINIFFTNLKNLFFGKKGDFFLNEVKNIFKKVGFLEKVNNISNMK